MPGWIHDRAQHIREKNPDMPESQSWAIATQQAYAAGKAPKSYGTAAGRREAKQKYDDPKSHYEKRADPPTKEAMVAGFFDELHKIAAATGVADVTKVVNRAAKTLTGKPTPISPSQGVPRPVAVNQNPISHAQTAVPQPVTSASAGSF